MKIINCILIGLGNIGVNYDANNSKMQTHAKALVNHKKFNLLCGVDSSHLARNKFRKKYRVPVYSHLNQVPFKKIDFITIATPTNTHYKIIKKVKLRYPKAFVLLEKPISYCIKEAEEILKVFPRNKLFVNYHRLSEPSTILIKKIITNYKKKFNLPLQIKVKYTKNILHNCSHFFNLLNFWLGDILDFKVISLKKVNNDYVGNLFVKYIKANVHYISSNNLCYSQIDIQFKDKIIKYRKDGEVILLYKLTNNKILLQKKIKNNMKFSQLNVYKEIYNCLSGKKNYNICSGLNAFNTLKCILDAFTINRSKN